ncbi:PDZ domain-containing RING finger protein 4-like isoform X1 [Triplophysa rosa]|uniref:PDZ domain-containing RING finger protein 4-like n=1 Tax=Triplophysa rosa TaxID=992332 RepID=A0A9W7X026_TRIRA|nr:PDZ domain-containing RING finger protein 4-like isoform X1 [Triplophysa rosa]KAI7811553.1 putative PDZ domain-containing RING finger protein 4-like [Triplophysa rosa]
MGCNLCSLQKREEHYKLLYEISQVNGRDLSRASHEEAVEAFRSAKDPIVVQVLRRTPLPRGQAQDVQVVDVCTQTEITFEHIMALAKLRPTTPPVPDICPFLLSDSCHSLHSVDQENFEDGQYLNTMMADGERPDDFEYEEVELCRMNSEEKLGLTLCYRTDDEEDIAIYVSEIEPNSIAARDGRIREGDRILQINGRDVQDKQESVAVLSNEECRNIVLLVCRPEIQEEPWLDDEHSEFLEELKMEMLEEQRREEEEMDRAAREEEEKAARIKEDITASCSYNQTSQKDGSEKNFLAQIQKRLSRCLRQRREAAGQSRDGSVSGRVSGEGVEDEVADGDCYQQLLELKCQIRNSGEYDLFYSRSSTIECSLREQSGGVQHELRLLNEELRSIELECQNIMQAHQLRTQNQGPRSPRHAGKLADISEHPEKSDKDSSSAYNTAESSRSTPLAMDRSPEHSVQRMITSTNQKNLKSSFLAGRGLPPCPPVRRAPSGSPDHSNPSESDQTPPADDERSLRSCIPRHQQTDHARHYQSVVHLIQQQSAVEYAHSLLSGPQAPLPSEPKMEWKVKLRSDGTRYITKRPVRDRLLRERALKIKEERSGGMTTDDDAMSEMKMGRYWSKEERKQQLLRAKEQRRRREFMQRSRLECLRENPQSGGEGRKEVSIIELSHRKMMKKRNKKILDNWMTIQELMTHGAKAPEASKVHNAFLSVTTV